MRSFEKLIAVSILTALGAAASAAEVDRSPKFVSVATNQLISEVRAADQFYFEKCDFFHLDGSSLAEELSAKAFVNCAPLGAAQPIAARAAVESQLNLALADRRLDLADPSVGRWTLNGFVQGALFGGLIPVVTRRVWIGRMTSKQALRTFVKYGALFGTATAAAHMNRAIKRQGKNRSTLGLVDAEMPNATYVLDQRSNDRRAQAQAMDHISAVISGVMTSFVP